MTAALTLPAPLRRPVPAGPVFDQRTITIVVSGYPPVVAVAIYAGDHRIVAGTMVTLPAHLSTSPGRARCHRCRAWGDARTLRDDRLGWVWWCPKCVAVGVIRCEARHHRLPAQHEFWCPRCGAIKVQATDAAPIERDGRRRHICCACRRAEWAHRQTCRSCHRRLRRDRPARGAPWHCPSCVGAR